MDGKWTGARLQGRSPAVHLGRPALVAGREGTAYKAHSEKLPKQQLSNVMKCACAQHDALHHQQPRDTAGHACAVAIVEHTIACDNIKRRDSRSELYAV